MAWWLQGDLQPFAHFRSGMGRSPGGSVGAAAAGAAQPPCGRSPAARRAAGLRPVLTLCRDWVRGMEQSKTCREQVHCGQSTRR